MRLATARPGRGARVVATVAGRSARTSRLAARAELELLPDLRAVAAAADVVLSIVPPAEAPAVVAEVARTGGGGATAARGAERVRAGDAPAPRARTARARRPLDLRAAAVTRSTTRVYLSGPRAADVAGLPFAGVEVVVGSEPGSRRP